MEKSYDQSNSHCYLLFLILILKTDRSFFVFSDYVSKTEKPANVLLKFKPCQKNSQLGGYDHVEISILFGTWNSPPYLTKYENSYCTRNLYSFEASWLFEKSFENELWIDGSWDIKGPFRTFSFYFFFFLFCEKKKKFLITTQKNITKVINEHVLSSNIFID